MNIQKLIAGWAGALFGSLESLGASLVASFGMLLMGYAQDERQIFSDCKQFFHDTYVAKVAAGMGDLEAIEEATTAALNKFAHDENSEFHKILSGVIDFTAGSLKRAAGVLVTATSG
jgi:hypothetical protein